MLSFGLSRTLKMADESEAALHNQVQTLYGLLDRLRRGTSILESSAPKRDEDFFSNQDKIDSRLCLANKTEDEALAACGKRVVKLSDRVDWIDRIYRRELERGSAHAK